MPAVSERSIVQATLWNSPYLGNVMSSELELAKVVRTRLGLGTHFVLAEGAAEQPWTADLEAAGTTWSVLPARGGWRTHMKQVIEAHNAAVVHTHFTTVDLAAAHTARAAGIPCVWHVRTGFNGYPPRQRIKDLLKMRLVARRDVARIVTVSPWLSELMQRRGVRPEQLETIPNAIVFERFADMPSAITARERFGLDADADVVLGLAWWPDIKGADLLLDALERIADRHPSMQALLVGEELMRAFLEERYGEQLPPWLRVSGFVDDAAWLYAAADVFVSASRHEGQSSAIGEAIGCGLGVAMSDIPGTAGWGAAPHLRIFPSEDVAALALTLDELLSLPAESRAVEAEESRHWAHGTVGIDSWSARLCDLYESLMRG